MQKVKCDRCGAEVPVKSTYTLVPVGKPAERVCEDCYYKAVAEWQQMVDDLKRRTANDSSRV